MSAPPKNSVLSQQLPRQSHSQQVCRQLSHWLLWYITSPSVQHGAADSSAYEIPFQPIRAAFKNAQPKNFRTSPPSVNCDPTIRVSSIHRPSCMQLLRGNRIAAVTGITGPIESLRFRLRETDSSGH